MKKSMFFISILGMIVQTMQAQNTVNRQVTPFTKINVYGDISVELIKGNEDKVELEIPEDIAANKITTVVEKEELKIKSTVGLLKNKKKMKAYVTFKHLDQFSAGGSGELILPDSVLKADTLVLSAYTDGNIELSVDVKKIVADISENAVIELDGYTNNEDITVSTGGVYSSYDLESKDATVKAVTKGIAKINATMSLTATANTVGYVGYIGDPKYKFFTPKLGGKIEKVKEDDAKSH